MIALPGVGQYGVTPGGGLPMRAVRWWTGGFDPFPIWRPAWAGHAAMVREIRPDHPTHPVVVIEATPGGVRRRELSWDELGNWRFSNFILTEAMLATVPQLDELIGAPYDWPSVAEVGIRVRIARFRGYAADHPDEHLFCSELCAWWFRDKYLFDLFPTIAPGTVSPVALDRRRVGPLSLVGGPKA
jgi:hypothetical protein